MVEVVFDEITRKSLEDEKIAGCEIICLGYLLDIGYIDCDLYGIVRKNSIRSLLSYGNQGFLYEELEQRFLEYRKEAEKLVSIARMGESLRVWGCPMSFSICGLYLLCDMLRDIECEINLVDFPEEKRDISSSFGYAHWGILKPRDFISQARAITREEKEMYSDIWRSLKKENSTLRIVLDGNIKSVSEEYFEDIIWEILPDGSFNIKEAIGNMIRKMPVYINLGLVTKKIYTWIEDGRLFLNKRT